MKKIIFFDGGIETQNYFSFQLAHSLKAMGHEICFFNLKKPLRDERLFFRFLEPGNTVLLCFNYHGFSGEYFFIDDDNGHFIWDDLKIPVYNIVVDHPYYYHVFLDDDIPSIYTHISIDRNHEAYMKRFFPEIRRGPFIPLAGTRFPGAAVKGLGGPDYDCFDTEEPEPPALKPLEKRSMDVSFIGNYTIPVTFDKYINRLGDEYARFYWGIIDDMLAHPSRTLEEVAEEHILLELPDTDEAGLKSVMPNLIFIDNYVRFTERERAIRAIAESGTKVHLFGGGWVNFPCDRPENLVIGNPLDSAECLEVLTDSKISLNVMPWFKDGAHDRIFSTMLNGAVSLTDSSVYLDEILTDGEDCLKYDLSAMDRLPEIVSLALSRPDELQETADRGRLKAERGHTWGQRALTLHELIEND